jgi:aspartate/glutamate racemase
MRRIRLLGGMSWESSATRYRLINEATRDRLGGLHSADCILRSSTSPRSRRSSRNKRGRKIRMGVARTYVVTDR